MYSDKPLIAISKQMSMVTAACVIHQDQSTIYDTLNTHHNWSYTFHDFPYIYKMLLFFSTLTCDRRTNHSVFMLHCDSFLNLLHSKLWQQSVDGRIFLGRAHLTTVAAFTQRNPEMWAFFSLSYSVSPKKIVYVLTWKTHAPWPAWSQVVHGRRRASLKSTCPGGDKSLEKSRRRQERLRINVLHCIKPSR